MGFERFAEYGGAFDSLNSAMGSDAECEKYFNRWMARYSSVLKVASPNDVIAWDIRLYRSLKELFSAATFYLDSRIALDQQSWPSFYFLSYYSLFHAFWANLFLLPDQELMVVANVNHTKVINVFESVFVKSSPAIVQQDVRKTFELLKYVREYYSYQMPMNDFLFDHREIARPDHELPDLLKSSIQLAHLHSIMIEKAAKKNRIGHVPRGSDFIKTLVTVFKEINAKPHPITGVHLLDPADRYAVDDRLKHGCSLDSFAIVFEHFVDEFGHYLNSSVDSGKRKVTAWDISSFVGAALG